MTAARSRGQAGLPVAPSRRRKLRTLLPAVRTGERHTRRLRVLRWAFPGRQAAPVQTGRGEPSDPGLAQPSRQRKHRLGADLKNFILITCRLKENETNLPYHVTVFWEADRITGPYRLIHYLRDWGPQTYFPNLPAAFRAPDGRSAWLCVSGNYSTPEYNPHQCRYAASRHEFYFEVPGRELPQDSGPGRHIAREALVFLVLFGLTLLAQRYFPRT